MSKEEIIRVFEKMQDAFLKDTEFRNAIEGAIEILSQPPLPANLDEAAEEYSARVSDGHHYSDLQCGFKAGAEWMAEQGVSMGITDETEWADVDTFVHRNCDGATEIQIRKKQ